MSTKRPESKYKIGDHVQICGEEQCNGWGFWFTQGGFTEPIMSVGGQDGRIKQLKWNTDHSEWYYNIESISQGDYIAEHALSLVKPKPKYKIGEKVLICDAYKCNGSGWLSEGNRYYKIDAVGGHSFTINEDIIWREDKQEWYYRKSKGHEGYVAEHALSLINNKKPENGKDTTSSKEVQRSIEPISTREGSSGTIVQGRRSTAQIVSRPVEYQTVIGRS